MERSGPAVFVFTSDGDVMAFPHIEDAEGFMEAIDVRQGEYDGAFTLDGWVVAISTAPDEGRWASRAIESVSLRVTSEQDVAELRSRLARSPSLAGFMGDRGDLTAIANELLRSEWEQRWPHRPHWLSQWLHGAHPPRV